jgi:SAM-dependent methyltransferase
VDVRICTTPRPLLRERTDGDCWRRRTLRGGGDHLVSPDRRYPLELDQAEVERYRTMAEAARQAEADLWEPAGIVAGARVADVGCGPGAMLPALSAAVGPDGRVTAVDADPEAVAAARALVAAASLGNVAVREGRADATGLEAGSLDVVMLRHVLAHNGGAEDAIVAHLATLLGSGGRLYLVDTDGTAIRAPRWPTTTRPAATPSPDRSTGSASTWATTAMTSCSTPSSCSTSP